jgi:integrase
LGVKVRKPKDHASWCVVIDHKGQRKTKTVGSREAAERVKRELEARLALGGIESLEPVKNTLPTLADYAETWLKNLEQERKPSTAAFYSQYFRLYVGPRFGALALDAIQRAKIKEFIAELGSRDLAKNTIRLAVTTLRALLSSAVEDGLLQVNPAKGLGRFVKSEKAPREATALRPDEVEHLLNAARRDLPFQDYALLLTALRAGLREGELAALRWEDIHVGPNEEIQDRFILVQQNYDRRWSRRMLTPKNRKSRRVDMSRELRRVLLQLRQEHDAQGHEDKGFNAARLVFPSQSGTPIEMNNFYARTFKPLVARAACAPCGFTIFDIRSAAC